MSFRLEVAPRRGPRVGRVPLSKKTGIARSLEEIEIAHQLQHINPFRWELASIRFETPGLLVRRIRIELKIVLSECSIGRLRQVGHWYAPSIGFL